MPSIRVQVSLLWSSSSSFSIHEGNAAINTTCILLCSYECIVTICAAKHFRISNWVAMWSFHRACVGWVGKQTQRSYGKDRKWCRLNWMHNYSTTETCGRPETFQNWWKDVNAFLNEATNQLYARGLVEMAISHYASTECQHCGRLRNVADVLENGEKRLCWRVLILSNQTHVIFSLCLSCLWMDTALLYDGDCGSLATNQWMNASGPWIEPRTSCTFANRLRSNL